MAEVDPGTGLPKEIVDQAKKAEKIRIFELRKGQSDQLNADLRSEQGQMIMNKFREQFLAHVNALIDKDPVCSALKKFALSIQLDLNMGEFIVNKLLEPLLKKKQEGGQ